VVAGQRGCQVSASVPLPFSLRLYRVRVGVWAKAVLIKVFYSRFIQANPRTF
jgi:hypothetical protein